MSATYEKIKDYLNSLEERELVSIHNQYCEQAGCFDDTIYTMDEFDEFFRDWEPWEIARCCFYGDFYPASEYFWFNGYGNVESSDFPKRFKVDTDAIADYILETMESLGIDELEELLEREV